MIIRIGFSLIVAVAVSMAGMACHKTQTPGDETTTGRTDTDSGAADSGGTGSDHHSTVGKGDDAGDTAVEIRPDTEFTGHCSDLPDAATTDSAPLDAGAPGD